ncbi:MAG: helix-turn-helix domain-containing protein [Deltaproteobacteria bacterium]|nr:helix-turn-helix domain-containing protein [Deltaproteobacteria bacterium]
MAARHVVLLALPGVQLLDLAGPLEVFDAATRVLTAIGDDRPGYRTTVTGPQREVVTASGLPLVTTSMSRVRGPIDTLMVGGALDFPKRRFDPTLLRWFRRRAAASRRVASVCSGAFVLAQAGLLQGRRATTHWLATDELRRQYPDTQVDEDALHVEDDGVFTSAGVTAGIDLALALVESDLGHEISLRTARLLVMFLHRPGGQSQFSAALTRPPARHEAVRRVQSAVLEQPGGDHRVPTMARHAGMSPRHFARVFTEQTQETPARFVQRVRLERAQQLLEDQAASMDEVAQQVGFGSSETMRRTFVRAMGVSPGAYQARFRSRAS